MWMKRVKVPVSDSTLRTSRPVAQSEAGFLDRRTFLGGAAALLLVPLARAGWARDVAPALPAATQSALAGSPYVYVSPLRSDGAESRCHGEVWYGWFDGAVHLTTSHTTWKARAVAQGLDRARIWVGDHGRWKQLIGRNEAFRSAPRFDATVRAVADPALVAKLLAVYPGKYPAEFPAWKERMEQGHADGSRVLLRYEPILPSHPPAGVSR